MEIRKKEVDERQKEVYLCLSRLGKAFDKVRVWRKVTTQERSNLCQKFTSTLPTYNPLFAGPDEVSAVERIIALHLLRTGQFSTAETFIEVSVSRSEY